MLKDENSYVRQAAIKSLGDRQVQQAVPLLIQALEDPYKGVKLATLKALYQITQKEWGQEYPRLDLQKKMIQEYQQWWKTTQSK
jgi:HEAT repeat protein